jgi:hypothetical protein
VLGDKDRQVYGALSKEFGRGNKQDAYIQKRFRQLAIEDPRDKDKVRTDDPERAAREKLIYPDLIDKETGEHYHDARLDDYITEGLEKPNGYSGMQDTLFIPMLNGNPLEIECQIVDEVRHWDNMYAEGTGRAYYKTELVKYAPILASWLAAAKDILAGREIKNPAHTLVFGERGNILHIPGENPTVEMFLKAANQNTEHVGAIRICDSSGAPPRPVNFNSPIVSGNVVLVRANP